jgi:hypothetical protein
VLALSINACGSKDKKSNDRKTNSDDAVPTSFELGKATEFGGIFEKVEDHFELNQLFGFKLDKKSSISVVSEITSENCKEGDYEFYFLVGKDDVFTDPYPESFEKGSYQVIVVGASEKKSCDISGSFTLTATKFVGEGDDGVGDDDDDDDDDAGQNDPEIDPNAIGNWSFDHTQGSDRYIAEISISANGKMTHMFKWNDNVWEDYAATITPVAGGNDEFKRMDVEVTSNKPGAMSQIPIGTIYKCIYKVTGDELVRGCNEGDYPDTLDEAEESVAVQRVN